MTWPGSLNAAASSLTCYRARWRTLAASPSTCRPSQGEWLACDFALKPPPQSAAPMTPDGPAPEGSEAPGVNATGGEGGARGVAAELECEPGLDQDQQGFLYD